MANIFGIHIPGTKYSTNEMEIQHVPKPNTINYATPMLPIPKGDLTRPIVDNRYHNNNFVLFGLDNLYPQLLANLYYKSPIHNACINFIKLNTLTDGFKFESKTMKDELENKTFQKSIKFNKFLDSIILNYIIHKRVNVKMCIKNGKLTYKFIDPCNIRANKNNTKLFYSYDWATRANVYEYCNYDNQVEDGEYIYVHNDLGPGQETYAIPDYNTILNWCALDNQIPTLFKSNMDNSIFPSIIIKTPFEFDTLEEKTNFIEAIKYQRGVEKGGNIILLESMSKDLMPEVEIVSIANNDKSFETTLKEVKDNICIAHNINPSLMGVKVAGQLGNTEEIKNSRIIFNDTVINPLKSDIEDIINELILNYNFVNKTNVGKFTFNKKEIPTE